MRLDKLFALLVTSLIISILWFLSLLIFLVTHKEIFFLFMLAIVAGISFSAFLGYASNWLKGRKENVAKA